MRLLAKCASLPTIRTFVTHGRVAPFTRVAFSPNTFPIARLNAHAATRLVPIHLARHTQYYPWHSDAWRCHAAHTLPNGFEFQRLSAFFFMHGTSSLPPANRQTDGVASVSAS